MSFSWAMSGHVTLPRDKVTAYRNAAVDPTRYDDWSDDWDELDEDAEPLGMTVDKVLDVYAHADAPAIGWTDGRLDLRAVFSNDSDCWLTFRSELAAAVRVAADFGGGGELAITGYLDGGPDQVYLITCSADGASAFEVLTARRAEPIAKRVFADVKPFVEAMVAGFRANAKPITKPSAPVAAVSDAKQARAAISALRKTVAAPPHVRLQSSLPNHAAVAALRDSGSSLVRDAARTKLDELTKGSKLARLRTADHVYVYALALVLEPLAIDDDLDVLFRIWSEAPGFMLMNPAGIARHGERGNQFLATLFGKPAKNEYAGRLQALAARALLRTDEPAAAAALDKLVRSKRLSDPAAWSAQVMIQELRERPSSTRWSTILLAAVKHHAASFVGYEALAVLSKWNHPRAAKLVVAGIGETYSIEQACALVEPIGDRSVLPALRKQLKTLGPKQRRERDRLEQCIELLSKG